MSAPASSSPSDFSPTRPQERIVELDILRGFAVLGILLVNMKYFMTPFYPYQSGVETKALADHIAEGLISFFALGKFYTLFSFLFGLGLAIQMKRAEGRGVVFVPLYARRLTILFIMGMAHTFLLWDGDILAAYATLGFALLLFRRRPDASLIRWSVFFLLLPIAISAALVGLIFLAGMTPEGAELIERSFAANATNFQALAEQSLRVYARGTIPEILAQHVQDFNFVVMRYFFNGNGPHIFACFLFGLFVGRRGWFRALPSYRACLRTLLTWSLVVGIAANALLVFAEAMSAPSRPSPMGILKSVAFAAGAPAFSGFYVASILLLAQQERWRRRFAPLEAVGRLALSNYLGQSLICTLIFYSYGLGLYGAVGSAAGLALTVGVWIFQILLSVWWVRHFRFGPVEWLWRSLTYLRRQPLMGSPSA